MSGKTNSERGEVIRVSEKGQATIPKALRERFGIDTPGRVYIYEDEGRIVVEPLPSVEEMQGIRAGTYERGEVLEHLREMRERDIDRERERDERLESIE